MSTREKNRPFQDVLTARRLLTAAAATSFVLLTAAPAADAHEAEHFFTNVAWETGLKGVRGKSGVFTDLNGDGRWDLVLDRRRFYLAGADGKFVEHTEHGIPFPELEILPVGQDGKPNRAKAIKRPYVPHYLYFADVDNDGDTDAVLGVKSHWQYFDGAGWRTVEECDHGQRSRVMLNDGKGVFSDATPSGLSADEAIGPAMALAIVDTDLDGNLDLYEGREYRQYGVLAGCGIDRLWKGDGKGGYTDVTAKAGLLTVPEPAGDRSSRPTYGVTHADVNNDGYPDLLQMAYGRQWNYLWLGSADGTFTEFGRASGYAGDDITHGRYPAWLHQRMKRNDEQPFRSNGNTFDCAVADYDNDGDLDLFLGEITHAWAGESSDLPALLVNQGKKGGWKFHRENVVFLLPPRPFRGPVWNYGDLHVGWLDFDNDMLQDLLIASGDYPDGQFLRLYRQRPDRRFEEVTEAAGFEWEGCGSISLGDHDRDGDVDILAGRSFMRLNKAHREKHMGGIAVNEIGLFRNDVGNRNNWLNVRLVGGGAGQANRAGIGARVEVTTGGVTQMREIRCGSGLANHQDPPEACFGLAKNTKVEKLVIRWPDKARTVQTFTDLPANRFVVVTQGEEKPSLSEN